MRKVVTSLALATGLLLGFGAQALEEVVRLTEEQAHHIGIRTLKPQLTSGVPLERAPARVSLPPQNEYIVSAPQAGVISKVEVALGVKIAAGQVLAQIQSPNLLALQRELLDAASQFNLARAKLDRDKTLLEEGIVSKMRWQETKSAFERYATALREAEQVLAAAGVSEPDIRALKQSRNLTATLTVRSPITGVILERMAVAGQRVDLLAPLFRVGKLDELWLEINMPTERMGEIRMGDKVFVENTSLKARITHISQNVDPSSQTTLVRAVIEAKTDELRPGALVGPLRPGQNVNVQLMHASTDKLFRLPISALTSHEGKDYVFVRVPQGFAARPVAVAGRAEHEAVIHGGLNEGDEVVVQGVAALKASWIGIGGNE